MKAKTLSSVILLLAVAACQQIASTARAAVTFSVTPAAVSNFYAGPITLQIGGLNTGETVRIDKFLDMNSNGVIDAADWPVQSFLLTDGQASAFGGVTNINVPGDFNSATSAITAQLRIASDITQRIVAQYLFRLSSPTSRFTPITNLFNVTNSAYAQSFTGTVRNGGTNVPNAVVMVAPGGGKHGNPLAGVMANNSGNYTLNLPGGTYSFWLFKSNFVADLSQSPVLTLTNGATVTTNLHFLIPATTSISGHLVDAANTNIGVPDIFMVCQTPDRQLMAGACYTGTNGAFTVPVIAGQWEVSMATEGLAAYGYLGLNNNPQADTSTGSVSIATFALPKATALFYGTVLDSQSHPFAGLDIYCQDNNQQYEADYYTDTNGYFVAPVAGGLNNASWQVQVSSDVAPANYIFSQPSFNQNGGTNLSAGQAVLVNFTAVLATNHISGWLKDTSGNPIGGVGVWANATINGVFYNQGSVSTDTNGNYSLNVANGTWTLGVSTCNNCNDGLPSNYLSPGNQPVVISNTNATANFTALSATNHTTGHVQQANNSPIGNVGVWANATINSVNYNQYVDTDGSGNYSLNVANGSWTVGVECGSNGGDGLDDILGSGNYQCPNTQMVNIANTNGTANFVALLLTSQIIGYVNLPFNPIVNVQVYAYMPTNGGIRAEATTDINGFYRLNVPSGNWKVGLACCGSQGLSPRSYMCAEEQSTSVGYLGTVIVDFSVPYALGHVTGHLMDASNNPIPNVGVNAGNGFSHACATTANDGAYTLNYIDSTFNITLDCTALASLGYLCPPGRSVTLSNGNAVADFTTMLAPYTINGWVRNTNNQPFTNLNVYAYATIGTNYYRSDAWTDGGGNYSLPVGNSQWNLGVDCGGLGGGYLCPNDVTINIAGASVVTNFTIQPCGALQIVTTSPLPSGQVGSYCAFYLQASSCYPIFSWWVSDGSLPPGLNVDHFTGEVFGTPATNGTFNFTVRVTDDNYTATTKALSLTISPPPGDVLTYSITKMEAFWQSDAITLVPDTNHGPFNATLSVIQSAPDTVPIANVYLPGGGVKGLPRGSSGIELQVRENFASQAAFDAVYTNGNYTFAMATRDNGFQFPVLTLPAAAFPAAPRVSNFAAAQAINPASPFTLQWTTPPDATTNDFIWVFIVNGSGAVVFSTPYPATNYLTSLRGTAMSVMTPTNTFQLGSAYTGVIVFFRVTSVNTTAYPGAVGMTLMGAHTAFPMSVPSASVPVLSQPTRISATQFGFLLSGATGQDYTVLTATNPALRLSNWFPLLTTNLSASPVFIQDNQATNKQRFYRVKVGL